MIDLERGVCTYHANVCELIENSVHHGEKQPCQEVGNGYIF